MKFSQFFRCAFLAFVSTGIAGADIKLPAIISDRMVLQKADKVPVGETAVPGEEVAAAPDAIVPTQSRGGEVPRLGVYGENSMQRVIEFEAWLGRPVDIILCTVDFQKWENYRYSDWLSNTVYGNRGTRRLVYDVPIIIEGASYAEAKAGTYDGHWKCLAESIISNNPGEEAILIRPSHEMNGEWFAWGVGGSSSAQIPDFIESWRRFHGIFRGVQGGFRFRFSFSPSEGASDPRPMWPGDEFVDLVGYDVYWKPKAMGGEGWETNDPREAWRLRINRNGYNGWNLIGMLDFAQEKGKSFQIDEWGVWGPDAAPFVEGMSAFLREHGVPAHTYWNSDAAYPGNLSRRVKEWPVTILAFREQFGKNRVPPRMDTILKVSPANFLPTAQAQCCSSPQSAVPEDRNLLSR